MRFAIISDIHGNANALEAVLKDIRKENIDEFISVGDYYGELPYPNEVVDMIKSVEKKHVISGNKEDYLKDLHDSDQTDWTYHHFKGLYWNYRELSNDNLDYLLKLSDKKTVACRDKNKLQLLHDITCLFEDTDLNLLTSSKYAEKMDDEEFEHEEYLKYIKEILNADERFLSKLESIEADILVFGHTHVHHIVYLTEVMIIHNIYVVSFCYYHNIL